MHILVANFYTRENTRLSKSVYGVVLKRFMEKTQNFIVNAGTVFNILGNHFSEFFMLHFAV